MDVARHQSESSAPAGQRVEDGLGGEADVGGQGVGDDELDVAVDGEHLDIGAAGGRELCDGRERAVAPLVDLRGQRGLGLCGRTEDEVDPDQEEAAVLLDDPQLAGPQPLQVCVGHEALAVPAQHGRWLGESGHDQVVVTVGEVGERPAGARQEALVGDVARAVPGDTGRCR